MTNVKVERRDVLSREEFKAMLEKVEKASYPHEYYRLRDAALISIFRLTGKRVSEVAELGFEDVEVKGEFISLTFTVKKKRRGNVIAKRRTKLVKLNNPLSKYILNYLHWFKENKLKPRYFFPRTYFNPLFGVFTVDESNHLTRKQVWRIVKKINPNAWCHLFRETVGADIVRSDPSIMAPFRVMRRLDLESHKTAFEYMKRYAAEVIGEEEEEEVL